MSLSIGEKVKLLRKSRDVSQEVICAVLKMPLSTYSNKERLSKFTTDELQIICNVLKYPYELLISDAPFNPLQLNFERNDTLFVNQTKPEIENYHETEQIFYLTDKEKKLYKKLRSVSSETRNKIFDYINKIIDGEE